jgi:hypothetical protein
MFSGLPRPRPRSAGQEYTPRSLIHYPLLTHVTRIFQKRLLTETAPEARAGHRAGLFAAWMGARPCKRLANCAAIPTGVSFANSRSVMVWTPAANYNLRLYGTLAGLIPLFCDCYLQ